MKTQLQKEADSWRKLSARFSLALAGLSLLALMVNGYSGAQSSLKIETDVTSLAAGEKACFAALIEAARNFPRRGEVWSEEKAAAATQAIKRGAEAAEKMGHRGLADYLSLVGTSLTSAPIGKLDRAWMGSGSAKLVIVAGPASDVSGTSAPLTQLHIGLKNETEQRWFDYYLSRRTEFERWLPMPRGYMRRDATFKGSYAIADLMMRGGTAAESTSNLTRPPFDQTLRPELGRGNVFWKNMIHHFWYEPEVKLAAARVLVAEQQSMATSHALLNFYSTRFTTYDLGPQLAATEGGAVPLEERFGELHNPLVIAKADILGTLAHEWLIANGRERRQNSQENLAMLVTMSFVALKDALKGAAPPPHKPASTLILNYCCERKGISFDKRQVKWRIDYAQLRSALRQLIAEVLEIHATGDLARARALLDTHTKIGPELQHTLDQVAALSVVKPVPVYSVRGL